MAISRRPNAASLKDPPFQMASREALTKRTDIGLSRGYSAQNDRRRRPCPCREHARSRLECAHPGRSTQPPAPNYVLS